MCVFVCVEYELVCMCVSEGICVYVLIALCMFIISPQLFSPQLNQESSSGNDLRIANYPTSTGRTAVTGVGKWK